MGKNKKSASTIPAKAEKEAKTKKIFKSRRISREKSHYKMALRIINTQCKTLKLDEETTNYIVGKFNERYNESTQYKIFISFNQGQMINKLAMMDIVKNAIAKSGLKYKVFIPQSGWGLFEGDKALLDSLRECMPNGVKITPYGIDKIPFNIKSLVKEYEAAKEHPTENVKEAIKAKKAQNKKNAKRRFVAKKKAKMSRKFKKEYKKVESTKKGSASVTLSHKRGTFSRIKSTTNTTFNGAKKVVKHVSPITTTDTKQMKHANKAIKNIEKAELRKVSQKAYIDLQGSKFNKKGKGKIQYRIKFPNQIKEVKQAA